MLGTDLGFESNRVVTMSVSLAGTRYDTPDSSREYYRQALAHLRDIPGVEAAGAVDSLPLAVTAFMASNFTIESGAKVAFTVIVNATPGYFEAMGTRSVAGRGFVSSDQSAAEPLAIVNEEFARLSGLGRTLIGRRIRDAYPSSKPAKVIGIVANTHFTGPQYPVGPQLFLDAERRPPALMTFAARVRGSTEAYLAICRSAVQAIDPAIPVFNVKSLDDRLADTLARPRFYTTAVLFFAGFAILLAIVGVYGVASYSILQRTHELGVRMAIGASARRMRWSLLRQALLPVAAGVLLGAACAMGLGQFLEHLIATAQSIDAISFAIASLALVGVASIAIWSATRRILRLDPMQVLRAE